MKDYITVRKIKNLRSRLIECQAEYPHFTKVLVILGNGENYVFDYINEAISQNWFENLICECSFVQKDLMTGRDIIVIYANYEDVY